MVDFNKLRTQQTKTKPIEPSEIFRRLPKPLGINDLYTSQAEVLGNWFDNRNDKDVVVKLHTGGGKTLVGLLLAQSTLNEKSEPVLYLTPTVQLVNQTIEKAKSLGIHAVPYEKGKPLNSDFVNSNAIMVGTYNCLFNGKSKFGISGNSHPQKVGAIILDDAHAAFSIIRDSFTLEVSSTDEREKFMELTGLFRQSFIDSGKVGTFDDIISGRESCILEVPYWVWHEKIDTVREQLKQDALDKYPLVWPLLRDSLSLCHALIGRDSFTITPILPLMNLFPTFSDAPRRIYMSATMADDSDIVRVFDANPDLVRNSLTSRSLAGVSERMILTPELMAFEFDVHGVTKKILKWVSDKINSGSVVLVPSDRSSAQWVDTCQAAKGAEAVGKAINSLQDGSSYGPVVFANRYDGIDLPGNSCRLLVMSGLPSGTSNYELFRSSALYGGTTITKMLAQRIEQGIGRGARGSGDYCVILLIGSDLAGWIAKDANFKFLTSATKAQLEIGSVISKEINSLTDLSETIQRSFQRDNDWTEYHAERLAELVDETQDTKASFSLAGKERKAINLWRDGYHQNAINKLEDITNEPSTDLQTRGWMKQLSARITDEWGLHDQAEDLQKQAYSLNNNLIRPKTAPIYRPLQIPSKQSSAIIARLAQYNPRMRRGILNDFENTVSNFHENSSANQFEQSLHEFALMLGFKSERHDNNGYGPDILWLLPEKTGLVIEAKNRKKNQNPLTKSEHGQLLVAGQWFSEHYPDYTCFRVSVHAKNKATEQAVADKSYALTYVNLTRMVSDARVLLEVLANSQLPTEDLEMECERLISVSPLKANVFVQNYLVPFEV